MKKWSKPQLFNLSLKNTESQIGDNCFFEMGDYGTTGKNQHWCHSLNNGVGGWHNNGCGHSRDNHHQTPDDPDHSWDGESHKSKCCCSAS